MRKTKFLRGFTLIELMVVIAIFTVILGASYALMSSGKMIWYSGDVKVELQQDLRQAMDDMSFEISESSPTRIAIAAGGNSITLQTPVDENGSGTWEDTDGNGANDFYLEDVLNASGNIRWGGYLRAEDKTADSATLNFGNRAGRQIRYILVGNGLRRHVLSGGVIIEDFLLADDIENPVADPTLPAVFVQLSSDVVEINLSAQKITMDQHPVEYRLTTAIFIKNRN